MKLTDVAQLVLRLAAGVVMLPHEYFIFAMPVLLELVRYGGGRYSIDALFAQKKNTLEQDWQPVTRAADLRLSVLNCQS